MGISAQASFRVASTSCPPVYCVGLNLIANAVVCVLLYPWYHPFLLCKNRLGKNRLMSHVECHLLRLCIYAAYVED